jgi:hypothetical protein
VPWAFFVSAPDPKAEGASRGKASHADQATALAALTRNPRANFTEATMLSLPNHVKSDALALAVCLTAILILVADKLF